MRRKQPRDPTLNPTYRLGLDGDHLEQKCWPLFLRDGFPSYERFWLTYVVPATRRPTDLHFRSNRELADAGLGEFDLYLAQLHYSVLWHLAAAYAGMNRDNGLDVQTFADYVIRLSSATDCADELLARHQEDPPKNPWDWSPIASQARNRWREKHTNLEVLRRYRNHFLHSGAVMNLDIAEVGVVWPKPGLEAKYADWRRVTDLEAQSIDPDDFASADAIAEDLWVQVLGYLEENWQLMLTARGTATTPLPDLPPSPQRAVPSPTYSTSSTPILSMTFIPPKEFDGRRARPAVDPDEPERG